MLPVKRILEQPDDVIPDGVLRGELFRPSARACARGVVISFVGWVDTGTLVLTRNPECILAHVSMAVSGLRVPMPKSIIS